MRRISRLGARPSPSPSAEHGERRAIELDRDLGDALGQPLAGAHVERHAGPAPVVDEERARRRRCRSANRGRRPAPGGSPGRPAPPMRAGPYWPGTASARTSSGVMGGWSAAAWSARRARASAWKAGARLHGDGGHHLQQVILDHVAQRAGFLVVGAAAFDADRFRGGDLHVVHVAPVPQRLEDAVAEAEGQNVLHGLLAQVVIDAVDLGFGEDLVQLVAQLARAGQVVPEGLLDHQAPPAASPIEAGAADPGGDVAYWLGCVER